MYNIVQSGTHVIEDERLIRFDEVPFDNCISYVGRVTLKTSVTIGDTHGRHDVDKTRLRGKIDTI